MKDVNPIDGVYVPANKPIAKHLLWVKKLMSGNKLAEQNMERLRQSEERYYADMRNFYAQLLGYDCGDTVQSSDGTRYLVVFFDPSRRLFAGQAYNMSNELTPRYVYFDDTNRPLSKRV